MVEYIDKELAIEGMWAGLKEGTICGPEDTETFLRSLPAADVEPVRHGRWKLEPTNPYDDPGYKNRMIKHCSCCGWQNACRYNYCPNCGAKMDGEV